jgi:sugar phosphate isomerase/epimerase
MNKLRLIIAAALVGSCALAQDAVNNSAAADKLGWQLAVHAYTFRKFSIFECIDKTAALGLKYMSLSGSVSLDGKTSISTVQLPDKDAAAIKKAATDKGLTLVNIGVVKLPPDEAQSRKVYECAKKLGIDTLVAEPEEAALDMVEKLCKEYNIKVAFHNHPKPSHYWNPDTVLAAVKGRTPLMGSCADTGHWLRSGLNPVECLKKLDGRVICLHFKDLVPEEPAAAAAEPATKKKKGESKAMHDVPWGTGVGNIKAQMAELKRQHFRGAFCVEYEYHWENSVPEITECVKFFNATCAELAKTP